MADNPDKERMLAIILGASAGIEAIATRLHYMELLGVKRSESVMLDVRQLLTDSTPTP